VLLVLVAYDGAELGGCAERSDARTVLGEVRAALARVGEAPELDILSRTDAGAHAEANVVVLRGLRRPEGALAALRRHLPGDVSARAAAEVEALPTVVSKRYRYTLDLSAAGDPFARRWAWRPPGGVQPERLPELAAALVGRRDWAGFARRGETREDLVRTVFAASWAFSGAGGAAGLERPAMAVFRVSGDGFTYRLVRSLVGAQVAVASGAMSRSELDQALAGTLGASPGHQAPARGLVLEEIGLSPEPAWRELAPRRAVVGGVRSATP